jgi:hypothetical protein
MNMKWNKKGRIYYKESDNANLSHVQCPTPLLMADRIRIFFATRTPEIYSLISYIDVDIDDPSKVLQMHEQHILDLGKPGTFDEHGMIPNFAHTVDGKIFLYYSGWSRAIGVPYKNQSGLAISSDGGTTFTRYSEGPCFGISHAEPLSVTGIYLVPAASGWHVVYSSGKDWLEVNGHLEHTYVLKYATSPDGLEFRPSGSIVIPQLSKFEASCRPVILNRDNTWHMWFSVRGSYGFRDGGPDAYRIGYATSSDFINWVRDDNKAGIHKSETGWDSQMICYPAMVETSNRVYMFYNGNGFGSSGFGYAELEFSNVCL